MSFLKNTLYIQGYMEIVILNLNESYNYFTWRDIIIYYIYNIFNLKDHLMVVKLDNL